MNSFRLNEKEVTFLSKQFTTPLMVVSLKKVEENYKYLSSNMPRSRIFYTIKANSSPQVLRHLAKLGASFDVASSGEIKTLIDIGVDGKDMIYANPVKSSESIAYASSVGVDKFTFDDESEIPKLAKYASEAKVLVRTKVENDSAVVNLNEKFGMDTAQVVSALKTAQNAGLQPIGLSFHVGSQSLDKNSYDSAIIQSHRLFDEAEKNGIKLSVLDISGGLPIPSISEPNPVLGAMIENINKKINELFPDTEIWSEPGRYMCGTAVNLISSVIGTKWRNGQSWYILDDGIYGSFNGILFDHWDFKLEFFKKGPQQASVFAGPSCDSIDIIARDYMAPQLEIGDKILSPEMGSYCSSAATSFNGFAPAAVVAYEDIKWK